MQTKTIIVVFVLALVGYSTYMVFTLLHQHRQQIQPQSYFRFQFLFYIHIFLMLTLLLFLKLDDFYHYMISAFSFFLAVFVAIFIAEVVANSLFKPQDPDELIVDPRVKTWLQSTYSDVYYLFYMYSIMGIAICGMFILVSEGITCWPVEPVNRFQGVLEAVDYKPTMEGDECAICLADFSKKCCLTSVTKCGHVFHQDCLKEWIRYNKICPLDRRSLMQL